MAEHLQSSHYHVVNVDIRSLQFLLPGKCKQVRHNVDNSLGTIFDRLNIFPGILRNILIRQHLSKTDDTGKRIVYLVSKAFHHQSQ